jgi:hypothetical protein
MEYEYYWIYCSSCDMTLVLESRVELNGEGLEAVICPQCGLELEEIRADDSYDFVGIACGYLYPGKPCCGGGY